jgi:hypothetical protein
VFFIASQSGPFHTSVGLLVGLPDFRLNPTAAVTEMLIEAVER